MFTILLDISCMQDGVKYKVLAGGFVQRSLYTAQHVCNAIQVLNDCEMMMVMCITDTGTSFLSTASNKQQMKNACCHRVTGVHTRATAEVYLS